MAEHNPQDAVQFDADESRSIDHRIRELRSQISDLGSEMDAHKTKVAGAMGGGVFLGMLGLLAGYDLLTGKAGVWQSVGLTSEYLQWLAIGLGVAALFCLVKGVSLQRRRDTVREARVKELQREMERLLARKEFLESSQVTDSDG